MNVDEMLRVLNHEQVDYLLIGGMNFLLRHRPELTFDVDIWVRDEAVNLARLNRALQELGAAWGATEEAWAPVPAGWEWLQQQLVYCLTTEHGALDVFREVRGLEGAYETCRNRAVCSQTAAGVSFRGLSDRDMLVCQEVLPAAERKTGRMETLRRAIETAAEQGGNEN
jgi:hypothetical protein